MDSTSQPGENVHHYNTISPSAKSLLLLKGFTDIPFARYAAELITSPDKYVPDWENKDVALWKRVVHFEQRYWSVDKAISFLPASNMLEIAAGFSFRGMDTTRNSEVHYIDTDLPDVIAQKKLLLADMAAGYPNFKGSLETIALNALDEEAFHVVADRFPKGPVVILNEGLLMYLDRTEKEKLCHTVYQVLRNRGGYWVNADIYIKYVLEGLQNSQDDSYKKLVEDRHIYDNMFDSFDVAEAFFAKAGFIVDSESEVELSKLSSLRYLLGNSSISQLLDLNPADKIRTTWCLKIDKDL